MISIFSSRAQNPKEIIFFLKTASLRSRPIWNLYPEALYWWLSKVYINIHSKDHRSFLTLPGWIGVVERALVILYVRHQAIMQLCHLKKTLIWISENNLFCWRRWLSPTVWIAFTSHFCGAKAFAILELCWIFWVTLSNLIKFQR